MKLHVYPKYLNFYINYLIRKNSQILLCAILWFLTNFHNEYSRSTSRSYPPGIVCIDSVSQVIEIFRKKRQWALYDDNRFDIYKFVIEETKHRSYYDFCDLFPVGRIHSTKFGANTNYNPSSSVLSPKGYSFFIEENNLDSCFQ